MSVNKMRAEFEAWAVSEGYALGCMISGHYIHAATSAAWHAWQASRAALVVELPSMCNEGDDYADGWNDALGLSRTAIEAAGVRVKP